MYSLGYKESYKDSLNSTVSLLRRTKELAVILVLTLLFAKKKNLVY